MTDRDLIKKLGKLKEIKPDASWLKATRDSLYTQISNSGAFEPSIWSSFVITFKSVMKTASTPAMALVSLMVILLGTSAYGHLLLSQAKPNQSLYIARELSEKAKLTTILNTNEREQMAGKFAANNAQDIIDVLSNPATQDAGEIAKLSNKLNEEIKTVKKSIAKVATPTVQNINTPVTTSAEVFSASSGKDEQGISLSEIPKVETSSTSSVQNLIKEANEVLNQLK